MIPPVILSDFNPIQIGELIKQEESSNIFSNLLALAKCAEVPPQSQSEANQVLSETKELVDRYGVSPKYISKRSYKTFHPVNLSQKENLKFPTINENPMENPYGAYLDERMEIFRREIGKMVDKEYEDCLEIPDDIIHVTCSGYMSPSPVQRLVAKKEWGTTVTHSYHMGCYGAFPAVRMAHGFMTSSHALKNPKNRVDLFHTEYLSLHLDITNHTPNNIVDMTLFGDGFIKYSAYSKDSFAKAKKSMGLEILSMDEEVIPNSEKEMTWVPGRNKFDMYLSKNVPLFIGEVVEAFTKNVVAKAGYKLEDIKDDMIFAVHPGGPRILTFIRERLGLSEEQMNLSWKILYENGNMSSVTVPYIWDEIVNDDSIPEGKMVFSMAFGPGLTACGMLMKKVGK